jgi:hypothetical protein
MPEWGVTRPAGRKKNAEHQRALRNISFEGRLREKTSCDSTQNPSARLMQRRDIIKLMASSAALSALPLEVLQAFREARADDTGTPRLRTLNAHQNETVITITEMIIPATETPGAKGAKVNEFIDLLLTEWFDEDDAKQFLKGLGKLDQDSRTRFGKQFIDCSAAQQAQLMKQWDDHAIAVAGGKLDDKSASLTHRQRQAGTAYTPAPPPVENFFYTLKKLTLIGYYTSQIGFSQELGKQIIPFKHAGCAPVSEARS